MVIFPQADRVLVQLPTHHHHLTVVNDLTSVRYVRGEQTTLNMVYIAYLNQVNVEPIERLVVGHYLIIFRKNMIHQRALTKVHTCAALNLCFHLGISKANSARQNSSEICSFPTQPLPLFYHRYLFHGTGSYEFLSVYIWFLSLQVLCEPTATHKFCNQRVPLGS